MSTSPELTMAEALVWASAFAHKSNETEVENHHLRAALALRAAYDAVDLLRASLKLAAQGNEKHAKELAEYRNTAGRVGSRALPPKHKETSQEVLAMAKEFIENVD